MQIITVTAKTYDEAITEALLELQTTTDHLDVEVIEEGKDGLLGVIGGKPWVIKAMALTDEQLEEKLNKKEEEKLNADAKAEEPEVKPVQAMKTIVLEDVAPVIEETVVEDFEIEVPEVGFQKQKRKL